MVSQGKAPNCFVLSEYMKLLNFRLLYFKYEYFIFSKMDISLSSLIQLKRLVPSMAHSLFSLMKRYFKSLMIHSNLNCGNVYYSKKIKVYNQISKSLIEVF